MKALTVRLIVAGMILGFSAVVAAETPTVAAADRVENWTGKTVMVFAPHPDDDTFSCGGIMAILAKNGNKVIIAIYTNDDAGSKDLEMTSERLARIRKAEEEAACAALSIPKENIVWLGYCDGDLEYADPQRLRGEAARLIKMYRPDAVFTLDPGAKFDQWHKTDHRQAAKVTHDAFIGAEWHLYYEQHLLVEGLKPYQVPVAYYYDTREPNYTVDITPVWEQKLKAAASHVSQFEPSLSKYTPDMNEQTLAGIKMWGESMSKEGDKLVERFRREEAP